MNLFSCIPERKSPYNPLLVEKADDWEFSRLQYVYSIVNYAFSPFGTVVIAGGSVRDILLRGRDADFKDIDVFLVNSGITQPEHLLDLKNNVLKHGILSIEQDPYGHNYEPFLLGNYSFSGIKIQLMDTKVSSIEQLLDNFDWDISRFAYNGDNVYKGMDVSEIKPNNGLTLHKITYPKSTLRRGFRFSERFHMFMYNQDLKKLCDMVSKGIGEIKNED